MNTNRIEPISFVAVIPPLQTRKFAERVKADGTVEKLKVRFFAGQEKSLQVRPYILHKGRKIEDLVTYPEGTNEYLCGDDDYLEFDLSIPVENDDEIVIAVSNMDIDDPYTLNVSVMIDYYGGKMRVV